MTQIFAHRGASGTHPENTMVAFKEADRVGADGIELDVQLSADGEVVVIHDEKLNRTTTGKGYVKDHTLKELKSLHAGYKFADIYGKVEIPTLEEVLLWMKEVKVQCNIELKTGVFSYQGLVEKVIQLVRNYALEKRIILSSFNHYSIVHSFRLAPEVATAMLYRDGLYMPWIYAASIGGKAIHPSIHVAPDLIIESAMKAGIEVRPYTINDEEKMTQLFFIGCSGFITDFPEKAVRIRNFFGK